MVRARANDTTAEAGRPGFGAAIVENRRYRIVYNGEIGEGRNIELVKLGLSRLFNVDRLLIENQLFCGKVVIVKQGLDHEAALRYQEAMAQAGAVCRVEPMPRAGSGVHSTERRQAARRQSTNRRKRIRDNTQLPDRREHRGRRDSD